MTTEGRPDRRGGRLRAAWQALRARATTSSTGADMARARLTYERFREILASNDATLQFIADVDECVAGRAPFTLESLVRQMHQAEMNVFVMVKNLNLLADNAHAGLYGRLRELSAEIAAACPPPDEAPGQPEAIDLAGIRLAHAPLVGSKIARLGEVSARAGVRVPEGFAISTAAFSAFMTTNGLWERAAHLDDLVRTRGDGRAFALACQEVQRAIQTAPVPESVAEVIVQAFERLAGGDDLRVAMRSSAVGEDTHASHAGQYHTELNVCRAGLLDAYRAVIASVYSRAAIAYRLEHRIGARDASMAVGCLRMLKPRCSGVMFTRRPEAPEADAVVVTAVPGLAAALVAGEQDAHVWVTGDDGRSPNPSWLSAADLGRLSATARDIEACLGGPQEVEWAIEPPDQLVIVQSRALVSSGLANPDSGMPLTDAPPLLAGGLTACPGIGAGRVVEVQRDEDLDTFPERGVLVARQALPAFSRVLSKCAAIVTDIGSPAGHMASLAREYGVPALVGCGRATATLRAGTPVTVDASGRQVFQGLLAGPEAPAPVAAVPDDPALATLKRLARLVTPLTLTDPASPTFRPASCQSLHDIARYVHEKTFEVVFHWGDVDWGDTRHARRLQVRLPVTIQVIDVGGGIRDSVADVGAGEQSLATPDAAGSSTIALEEVVSVPFRALLSGLLDTRLRWDRPRPLSARGFLAVVGERMAGLPGEALRVGGASYAIVSDRYLNFSTKAGYHFATIDTYCGKSINKNYVHFRFAGGAADGTRRERRVRFIASVLASLDFKVQTRADLLVARLAHIDQTALLARLEDLGRLCLCTRQMDMLMDSDASPEFFARAFLSGQMDRF